MTLLRARVARAFTLLELLLVVFLLAAVAASAASLADDADLQARYELTRSRRAQIREAILGTRQTGNGQPAVAGFVTDMGRLPRSLAELLERPAGASAWAFDSGASAGFGWRGPYLQGDLAWDSELARHAPLFDDGWGNPWRWIDQVADPGAPGDLRAGDLDVVSLGRDGVDAAASDPYDRSFPDYGAGDAARHVILLRGDEWQVSLQALGAVALRVLGTPSPALDVAALRLRVRRPNDAVDAWAVDCVSEQAEDGGVVDGAQVYAFTFAASRVVPWGVRTFELIEDADGDGLADRDTDGSGAIDVRDRRGPAHRAVLLPRGQQTLTLTWQAP